MTYFRVIRISRKWLNFHRIKLFKILKSCVFPGRRTTHNPFKDKDKAWDPYGIAKLDLSELLLGQRYLYISIPVHNCSSPDPTVGHDRPGGSIVGHAGSVDGPGGTY